VPIALIKEFGEGEDRKAKRSSPDCVVFGVAFHHMIEAAGGVLWRKRGESEAEIALVHRKRYDGDWTLPKGKLRPGELPLEGALREVCEESGYRPHALGYLGVIAYQTTPHGSKRVRFWNMVAEEQTPQTPDVSEVVETIWLPPREALLRMTYPLEKAILEAAILVCDVIHGQPESNPFPATGPQFLLTPDVHISAFHGKSACGARHT
jgi:8-oxo-dGTP diphosphatase